MVFLKTKLEHVRASQQHHKGIQGSRNLTQEDVSTVFENSLTNGLGYREDVQCPNSLDGSQTG